MLRNKNFQQVMKNQFLIALGRDAWLPNKDPRQIMNLSGGTCTDKIKIFPMLNLIKRLRSTRKKEK
jgi:hypothetical protein